MERMSKEIYLDNSSTTKVSPAVAQVVMDTMTDNYGNPSSLHSKGLQAELAIEKAADIIAKGLGVKPQEIIFTSGGTEANNLAIFGGVEAKKRRGKKIITTALEHSSVLSAVKELGKDGYDCVFVEPNAEGLITAMDIADKVDDSTILVSVMAVNNETGQILPIQEIAKAVRAKNKDTLIHCDGVQAFGKIPLPINKWDVDLLTISGHKIHCPKGVGALYIKKGVRLIPRQIGGAQQGKIRPGTQAVPLIVGFGKASEIALGNIKTNYSKAEGLYNHLAEKISKIDGIEINSPVAGSPYVMNISVEGYRSEIMLHALEQKGIYLSSGSACSKGEKSHVLSAMGLSNSRIDSGLRVSFSCDTTIEQIDIFIDEIETAMAKLIKVAAK